MILEELVGFRIGLLEDFNHPKKLGSFQEGKSVLVGITSMESEIVLVDVSALADAINSELMSRGLATIGDCLFFKKLLTKLRGYLITNNTLDLNSLLRSIHSEIIAKGVCTDEA
jgi:hypothetical protein